MRDERNRNSSWPSWPFSFLLNVRQPSQPDNSPRYCPCPSFQHLLTPSSQRESARINKPCRACHLIIWNLVGPDCAKHLYSHPAVIRLWLPRTVSCSGQFLSPPRRHRYPPDSFSPSTNPSSLCKSSFSDLFHPEFLFRPSNLTAAS